MARPTKYNEQILLDTEDYIKNCNDTFVLDSEGKPTNRLSVNIPTIEGLAYELELNKDTIYAWRKEHQEFSDLIDKLLAKQAKALVNNGLSGNYNPTITKVILTKHGYREGLDQTTNDKDLPSPILGGITKKNDEVQENDGD